MISGISAFKASFSPGKNPSADTLREWVEKGRFVWPVTPEILEEHKEVARRLNIRLSVAGRLVNLLREEAEEVTVGKSVEIYSDPGDNCFCACAEEGSADFLLAFESERLPAREVIGEGHLARSVSGRGSTRGCERVTFEGLRREPTTRVEGIGPEETRS